MNRLQKKCTIASTGFHLLLAVILIVGPGFLTSKSKTDDSPVLDIIPANLVDAPTSGGSPAAKPPPSALPQPPPPVPHPEVPPPKPQPPQPETKPEPDPPKDTPKDPPKPRVKSQDAEADAPVEHKRHLPDVPTTPVKVHTKPDKAVSKQPVVDTAAIESAARTRRMADMIQSTARSLKENASTATTVESPGIGGGEAYANYGNVVGSVYEHAWIAPDDAASDEAIAKVSVTIASDGSVISSRITKSSGDASVDRSVQRTLDRVTFVAPFPQGSKDKQRTFSINFNLKAKRLLG